MDVTNVVDEDKTVRRRLFLQRALLVELLLACFGYQILILQRVFFFFPHRIQPKNKNKEDDELGIDKVFHLVKFLVID
jgi:hypothetical protein